MDIMNCGKKYEQNKCFLDQNTKKNFKILIENEDQ